MVELLRSGKGSLNEPCNGYEWNVCWCRAVGKLWENGQATISDILCGAVLIRTLGKSRSKRHEVAQRIVRDLK